LSIPPSAELDALLQSHDKTIDILRAEIGQAKAEEGKAKEDAKRSKIQEERARNDLDKMKRSRDRGEVEARRREAEVSVYLSGLLRGGPKQLIAVAVPGA
jgi:septal ring factor EnvC (AmiA/AmiB activator)